MTLQVLPFSAGAHAGMDGALPSVVGGLVDGFFSLRLRDDDGGWRLEEPSVLALDILDEFSGVDYVSLDGSWLRGKSFTLAFHPDMSLKTVGLTDAGRASAGAASESRVERVAKPLIAPRAPAEQRSGSDPVELPSTSSDYEVLAATRARAGELTIHEQRRKISDDA